MGTTLLLGFWTAESIPGFHEGDYIALYAGFGTLHVSFAQPLFDRPYTRFRSSYFLLPTNLGICVSPQNVAGTFFFFDKVGPAWWEFKAVLIYLHQH